MQDRPHQNFRDDDRAQSQSDRNIPTPRSGDWWNAMTVMRVMKRLGLASK
jgi:hypothetical protein